ncbi:MAG: HAD hydrolase-like protein, partial [Patescibacteria group bacterium]
MKLKAILFDFDGTLVHSIDLLVRIFEEILAERKFPPVATEKIRTLVGKPFEKIFREITPLKNVEELVKD